MRDRTTPPGFRRAGLVIADLTGYTAYLTGSELEHAPAIAGDLLFGLTQP